MGTRLTVTRQSQDGSTGKTAISISSTETYADTAQPLDMPEKRAY